MTPISPFVSFFRKTKRRTLFLATLALLILSVSFAFPHIAPLANAHASTMLDATVTPSPTATSIPPTLSDTITNTEKSIFDPILAFLNFAAAIVIAFLVIFLWRKFFLLARKTNLVIDPFTDATGDDSFSKMTGGLYQVARECLVKEITALQKRIRENLNIGPDDYRPPPKDPVPEGTTDTQLSDLLKSLKDVTTGEVNTAVQLMSLIFVPKGTKVSSTLHCLDDKHPRDKHPRAAFSLEVIDLIGKQEPVMYSIQEPLTDLTQDIPSLGERYCKLLPVVMRWLAIELARRDMIAQASSASQKSMHYLAQVYNFIGVFYEASGQSYPDYPFFYELARQNIMKAIEFDSSWYQPYENLADIYNLMGQANPAKATDYLNQALSYYIKALDPLSPTGNGTSKHQQPQENNMVSVRPVDRNPITVSIFPADRDPITVSILPAERRKKAEESDPNIRRRIEIGKDIALARIGSSSSVSAAFQDIEQITENWKDIDSTEDDILLYNLGSCYALIGGLSLDAGDVTKAKDNASIYLAYSLVREYQRKNEPGDLWKYLVPRDPDFSSIKYKLPKLCDVLRQRLEAEPSLSKMNGEDFAKAIRATLKSAQIIS